MGGNGSFANGSTSTEAGRRWTTVAVLSNGVKIIELKDKKANHKSPEESHSPNSVYVMFNKDGHGIKSISKYGSIGEKYLKYIQPTIRVWERTTTHGKMGGKVRLLLLQSL